MKYFFSLLASILIFSSAFSQNETKAKELLDRLSKKNKSYTSISADFEYKLENTEAGINEIQKGSIILKGNKYKLSIAGQQIISNGITLWTYIKDADEVQISSVADLEKDGDNLFNPAELFTLYEKGFKYNYVKEETIDGKALHLINLFPTNPKDKAFHSIKLYIDKESEQIHSMLIMAKDGNKYTYLMKNFTPNKPFADTLFNFDTSKVGEVIDLR
jgi:outer membrane lipoprotein-sorting protein